jgi:hypothetical protein
MKSILIGILSPFPVSAISINKEELTHCVELAHRHGVEMLFYSRLKKLYAGSNACIDNYLKKNESAYRHAVVKSISQEVIENQIIAALGKQDIPACIIKGNEIARTIYEDPNCRSSADIDVLVKNSDVVKADLIMRTAHFKPANDISLCYFILHQQHAVYRESVYNNLIELHWNFGIPYFFRLSSEEIWKEVIVGEGGHMQLTPEMLLISLLIHHHNHSFSEMKILIDLLWTLKKYDQIINWPDFSVRLKKIGLTRVTMISICQIEDLWPTDASRIHSIKMLKQILIDMDYSVSKYLTSYFRMNLEGTSELSLMDKIVGRFALDGLDMIFLSYLKTIFPPPEAIHELFHTAGNLTLPIDYLRFICWRIKRWAGFAKI